MHWVNRPTTQVLAMFGRHDEAAAVPGAGPSTPAAAPAASPGTLARTGAPVPVLALLLVALTALVVRRHGSRA
jgi:hypothetical protein